MGHPNKINDSTVNYSVLLDLRQNGLPTINNDVDAHPGNDMTMTEMWDRTRNCGYDRDSNNHEQVGIERQQ